MAESRNIMARRTAEVDVNEAELDEAAVASDESSTETKTPKAKKEPARGDLPEGFVTPIGLAKVLTERGLHTNRAGEQAEVRPQMVYSYMKNAPKDDPFPIQTVQDSLGKDRQAVSLEEGVAWWERKNERTSQRKANAAEKAQKKQERAAAKAQAEAEGGSSDEGESATEAE